MPNIELHGITKSYGSVTALDDVTFSQAGRTRCAILGPSGSGKSTLLRLIAGLELLTGGEIRFDGVSIVHQPAHAREIGMVFQDANLMPHLNVRQNLGFGLKLRGMSTADVKPRVDEVLERLSLGPLQHRSALDLSGGERQRVAVGRLLASRPKTWLLDEPLSQLDPLVRNALRTEICHLQESAGATMLYVTHDQHEAMSVADHIVVLSNGKIQQVGVPQDVYEFPANRFVAGFLGSPGMNFVECTWENGRVRLLGQNLVSTDSVPSQNVSLGIRPESIQIGTALPIQLQGNVNRIESFGSERVVTVRVGDVDLKLREASFDRAAHTERNRTASLSIAPSSIHCFDADGQRLDVRFSLA